MPGSPVRTSFQQDNHPGDIRSSGSFEMTFRPDSVAMITKTYILGHFYLYHPTPAPEAVAIRDKPSRTKAACCWGW